MARTSRSAEERPFPLLVAVFCLFGCSSSTPPTPELKRPQTPPLEIPAWWDAAYPLPRVKSNCMRCHLTAGRELTVPLVDFAHSVHDLNDMTCVDCHGGNTADDETAHEAEFKFIGNKLSAHMAVCVDCHESEARSFRASKHYWDLTKSINLEYPVCIDCHGHHDVGKAPVEFSLALVCTDCHPDLETAMPVVSSVVAKNDRLWGVLRKVHAKSAKEGEWLPAAFRGRVNSVRAATSRLIHSARRPEKDVAEKLNARVKQLRDNLQTWLEVR